MSRADSTVLYATKALDRGSRQKARRERITAVTHTADRKFEYCSLYVVVEA